MTYHKEGPACGRIPCDPTSSEADCEYPLDPETEREEAKKHMENLNIQLPWPGWRAVKYLGNGQFGQVYEIERTQAGITEHAAVKIVTRPKDESELEARYENGFDEESVAASYAEELQQYASEYRLMLEMKGQSNIISCDDFTLIENPNGIGGKIYIRMELLTPLKKMQKEIFTKEETVIRLGMDICRALMLCEEKHIIHRDIKPENIMVSQFGDFKLCDFGVSRFLDHTTNASQSGTPAYWAPEIAHMEKYGKSVDLYSLGIMMYWMLNNRKMPFIDADEVMTPQKMNEALRRRYSGERLPMPAKGSHRLKQIVLKACAYRPSDRYTSANEMYADLEALQSGTGRNESQFHGITSGGTVGGARTAFNGTIGGKGTYGSTQGSWSGRTEGNAWNDDTQHTIGKPKQAHKQMWETDSDMGTVEETVGVRQAYAKQEQKQKQMIAQVKAEVSQAEEKKKNWLRWKYATSDLWLCIADTAIVLVVHYLLLFCYQKDSMSLQSHYFHIQYGYARSWVLVNGTLSASWFLPILAAIAVVLFHREMLRNGIVVKMIASIAIASYLSVYSEIGSLILKKWSFYFNHAIWIDVVAFASSYGAMLFLASGLVGDDTETTSEGVLWGAMPFYYYYTFYVIGKNLDRFEAGGIPIWMGLMLVPVVMLVAIYIMKSSVLAKIAGTVFGLVFGSMILAVLSEKYPTSSDWSWYVFGLIAVSVLGLPALGWKMAGSWEKAIEKL